MAIKEAVDHKIHAPAGIGTLEFRSRHPPASGDMPARALPPEVQSLLAVNPVYPLMIDAPTLAPKQDMDSPIAVPNPRLRDLHDPQPQGPVVSAMRAIPMR